jgi:hypothetical protein
VDRNRQSYQAGAKSSERRLLVVTESLGIGGTESHLIRLLPRLVAFDWSVKVFCLAERGERAEEVEVAGVKVISALRFAQHKRSLLRYPAHVTLAVNKLYWLMRRWRPQIAHFYLPGPYLIGAHVAIAARTPIKIMSRRSLSDYQRNWPLVARLGRSAAHQDGCGDREFTRRRPPVDRGGHPRGEGQIDL